MPTYFPTNPEVNLIPPYWSGITLSYGTTAATSTITSNSTVTYLPITSGVSSQTPTNTTFTDVVYTTGTTTQFIYPTWGFDDDSSRSRQTIYPTPDQLAQIEADRIELARQNAERARLLEERHREEAEATKRAEALLLESLSEDQRTEFRSRQSFRVISKDGERTYLVERGVVGNVALLNKSGKPIRRFCIHPVDVPVADVLLAQKCWLESNEEEFVRVANKTELVA